MREREFPSGNAERGGQRGGATPDNQTRAPTVIPRHLHVVPVRRTHSDTHRFECGFLGRESDGISLDGIVAAFRILPFGIGEQTGNHPGPTLQHRTESIQIDKIDSDAQDHDRQRSARSLTGSVIRASTGMSASRSSRKIGSVSVTACLMAA